VERPELGVAADRPLVDQDLRHRPAARQLVQRAAEVRVVVEEDLLVGDPFRVEQRLGADAVAAPARRVHADARHYELKRISSHGELVLHQGSGELQTVTGVELIRPHRSAREDPYRLAVGLIGLEAMLRLFNEPEANPRAFEAIARFLDVLDEAPSRAPERPAL